MNLPRQPDGRLALPRRGFLALGAAGGAAGLLAACGKEVAEPSSSRDVDLLNDALVGETNATSALGDAIKLAKGAEVATIKTLRDQASENADRVQEQLSKLNAESTGDFNPPQTSTLDDALNAAIEQTDAAVAAYRTGAGLFTTAELAAVAMELVIADGARLALLNQLLGKDEAPFAFVTGDTQPPAQSIEPEDTTTTSTTSSSTSTTTSNSEEGG
jgi:hypothetical protein